MRHGYEGTVLSDLVEAVLGPDVNPSDYQFNISLGKIIMYWTIDQDEIEIALVGQSKGWVAVGFLDANKDLLKADLWLGWISNGIPQVGVMDSIRMIDKWIENSNEKRNENSYGIFIPFFIGIFNPFINLSQSIYKPFLLLTTSM